MGKLISDPGTLTLLRQAVIWVRNAHQGQVRKGQDQEPFFNHPRRVCKAYLRFQFKTQDGAVAALCHDVVEDTAFTLNDVERGFGKGVRDLVRDLTKAGGRPHRDYLLDFHSWPMESKKIKLCDIQDNILSSRCIVPKRRNDMLLKWNRYLESLKLEGGGRDAEVLEYQAGWHSVWELCQREMSVATGVSQ